MSAVTLDSGPSNGQPLSRSLHWTKHQTSCSLCFIVFIVLLDFGPSTGQQVYWSLHRNTGNRQPEFTAQSLIPNPKCPMPNANCQTDQQPATGLPGIQEPRIKNQKNQESKPLPRSLHRSHNLPISNLKPPVRHTRQFRIVCDDNEGLIEVLAQLKE